MSIQMENLPKLFKDKKILVTGGTGTVGSGIVKEILKYKPTTVRVFSRDEFKQHTMQAELKKYKGVRFFLGDVRNQNRLARAMEDVDIVFHCAALKHVPSCEYNPFESVRTNVMGTQNVIESALNEEVEKVIETSTDKATNPTNTMGATKLLSERLMATANYYKGKRKTIFSCVRFGNVLYSRGSVVPLFKKQISEGGPVTITDPEMTRFIMSTKEAIELVFKATYLAKGGEIFIFKMPVVRLGDLVEVMIEVLGPVFSKNPKKIEVKKIGLRPGEKMYEELMTEEESTRVLETKDMFIVLPLFEYKKEDYSYKGAKPTVCQKYTSYNQKLMTKDEIREMIWREEEEQCTS